MSDDNLLEIKNLKKSFPVNGSSFSKDVGSVKAVNDVSLSIAKGKVLGLVGESGCGKSTLGRCILRLIEPDSGEVYYEGRNILGLTGKEMKGKRREMQIIFQDPICISEPSDDSRRCHWRRTCCSQSCEEERKEGEDT